ncbi:MAG TPA: NAD(P)-dependent oxidoreductase [Pseudolysinimonas sp.]|nr:NAD(P)-dependent oxidoreductase [Pseudolysinimonas sp.]
MSRVLIVGANSPLGTAIRAALVADGHTVFGVSRSGHGDNESVDISDGAAAGALLARVKPHTVVYLARPDIPDNEPEAVVSAAVDGLRTFLLLCAENSVDRLLFASSAAVYGTGISQPLVEEDPVLAEGAYAQLKLLSEQCLAEVAAQTTLIAVAFRIFNVYGPGFRTSLINRLVDSRSGGAPPHVFATNDFVRDYVHVEDVAAAFALAASATNIESGVVNLGTGWGTGNLDLLALLPDARWVPAGHLDSPSTSIADTRRLTRLLGLAPPARLRRDGLFRT